MVNKHVVLNLENVLLTLNYFAKIGTVNFRLGVGSSTRSYNEILLLEENHLADWSAESHYYHKILCRAGQGRQSARDSPQFKYDQWSIERLHSHLKPVLACNIIDHPRTVGPGQAGVEGGE